mmetsp:Transcript_25201/g.72912  ORF Transcript_25201/g.72912 Transcript_25201/m.72912 type:complete len:215 (-) Transcript_25201:868-1512(-)
MCGLTNMTESPGPFSGGTGMLALAIFWGGCFRGRSSSVHFLTSRMHARWSLSEAALSLATSLASWMARELSSEEEASSSLSSLLSTPPAKEAAADATMGSGDLTFFLGDLTLSVFFFLDDVLDAVDFLLVPLAALASSVPSLLFFFFFLAGLDDPSSFPLSLPPPFLDFLAVSAVAVAASAFFFRFRPFFLVLPLAFPDSLAIAFQSMGLSRSS